MPFFIFIIFVTSYRVHNDDANCLDLYIIQNTLTIWFLTYHSILMVDMVNSRMFISLRDVL